MGPVYATRLLIRDEPSERDVPSQELFDRVIKVCEDWLMGKAYTFDVPYTRGEMNNATRNMVRITSERFETDDARAWQAELRHPYGDTLYEPEVIFIQIEIEVREANGETAVMIRALLSSTLERIKPLDYQFAVPNLVHALIAEFPGSLLGNAPVRNEPIYLIAGGERRVIDALKDPDRYAPIVVISASRGPHQILCDPNAVARALAGMATVMVLLDPESGTALSRHLPVGKRCRLGGVRLYWPDMMAIGSKQNHPAWSSKELLTDKRYLQLPHELLSIVAPVTALRIGADSFVWELKSQRMHWLSAKLKGHENDVKSLKEALSEWEQLAQDADDKYRSLSRKVEELEVKLYIEQHKNEYARTAAPSSATDPLPILDRRQSIRSVADIADYFRECDNEASIVFLPSALESARTCSYGGSVETAWDLFIKLWKGAREYATNPNAKLKETMNNAGATDEQFKADTSDTARKMYRNLYVKKWMRPDGTEERIELGPHLSNGKGNRHKSLFIYWAVTDYDRRFVVGHIGSKLKDSSGGYLE